MELNHAFLFFIMAMENFIRRGAMAEWRSFKYTTAYIQITISGS